MKEIILDVLEKIACPDTGACQINLQSEGAREMIALALEEALDEHFKDIIESVVCGMDDDYFSPC